MLALPNKSLEYPKGLLEISRGIIRVQKSSDSPSLREIFWSRILTGALRVIWLGMNLFVKARIREIEGVNQKFASINDLSKLTAADYKVLKLTRDDSLRQLKETELLIDDKIPNYQAQTLQGFILPMRKRVTILNELFKETSVKEAHLAGFSMISEEEAWSRRTTAYDYAT